MVKTAIKKVQELSARAKNRVNVAPSRKDVFAKAPEDLGPEMLNITNTANFVSVIKNGKRTLGTRCRGMFNFLHCTLSGLTRCRRLKVNVFLTKLLCPCFAQYIAKVSNTTGLEADITTDKKTHTDRIATRCLLKQLFNEDNKRP